MNRRRKFHTIFTHLANSPSLNVYDVYLPTKSLCLNHVTFLNQETSQILQKKLSNVPKKLVITGLLFLKIEV